VDFEEKLQNCIDPKTIYLRSTLKVISKSGLSTGCTRLLTSPWNVFFLYASSCLKRSLKKFNSTWSIRLKVSTLRVDQYTVISFDLVHLQVIPFCSNVIHV